MTAASVVSETFAGFLDLLYPPRCGACGELGLDVLCAGCRAGFQPLLPPLCARCGAPAGVGRCRDCAAGTTRYLSRARAAGRFEGTLRQTILRMKYQPCRRLADPLGQYLVEFLTTGPFGQLNLDVVVPVPLHPARQRERGFNQSELLARAAAECLAIPVVTDALVRSRRTQAQADLPATRRATNIVGAFAVRNPETFASRTVLLIDDVLTTCSTANECARVLKESGATAVFALALARDV